MHQYVQVHIKKHEHSEFRCKAKASLIAVKVSFSVQHLACVVQLVRVTENKQRGLFPVQLNDSDEFEALHCLL